MNLILFKLLLQYSLIAIRLNLLDNALPCLIEWNFRFAIDLENIEPVVNLNRIGYLPGLEVPDRALDACGKIWIG